MRTQLRLSLVAAGLLAGAVGASPVSETDALYVAQAWRAGTDALGTALGKSLSYLGLANKYPGGNTIIR